jgi:intein/homing endonuclease
MFGSRKYKMEKIKKYKKKYKPAFEAAQGGQTMALTSQADELLIGSVLGCHGIGQGIMLADGSIKNVEDVEITDKLMGPDSKPRNILRLVRGCGKMVKLTTLKGEEYIFNEDHKLVLVLSNTGRDNFYGYKTGEVYEITIKDYINMPIQLQNQFKCIRAEIEFGEKELTIDPYLLGVLLGDGSTKGSIGITTADKVIEEFVYGIAAEYGFEVRIAHKAGNKAKTLYFNGGGGKHKLIQELDSLGLRVGCGEKFIPQIYKTGSKEQRLQLLAGLMDTDGHLYGEGKNCFDYISKSKQLAKDVVYVARSCGFRANMKECQKSCMTKDGIFVGTYYRVIISGNCEEIPNRIEYKKSLPSISKKDRKRIGFKIEELGYKDNYYGFTIDGDNRYVMDDFTITRNCGKSLILLMMPVRYLHLKFFNCLILRSSFAELENGLIKMSHNYYPQLGGIYNQTRHEWIFPSGACISFGFLEGMEDIQRYRGIEKQMICYDELSSFSEDVYNMMNLWLRTAHDNYPLKIVASSNSGGKHGDWILRKWHPWLSASAPYRMRSGQLAEINGKIRSCVVLKPEDNPYINREEYDKQFEGLPDYIVKQLRDGDWDARPSQRLYFDRDKITIVEYDSSGRY